MSDITLIGDCHAKIEELGKIYSSLKNPSIQLGDMGCGFTFIPHFDKSHRFIRGNHDSPSIARNHPNYLGDYGYLSEYGIFYIGGAFSIDADYRKYVMGMGAKECWWIDEELPYDELLKAIDYYNAHKPKIVVSHEVSSKVGIKLLMESGQRLYKAPCTQSRTAQVLQAMFENHQPKLWVYGHYHIDHTIEMNGTTFICLNELSKLTIDTENL